YLYLFNVDAAGTITCIFPNQFQNKNEIKANEEITVPDPNDKKFRIKAAEPTGKEQIKAIVTKNPSQTMKLEEFTRAATPRRVTKNQFARLSVEAMGGKPEAVPQDNKPTPPPDPTTPPQQQQSVIQQQKDKIQQDNPAQFKEKMKEWASGEIEIT